MFFAYWSRDTEAQKKGLCNTSEYRLEQSTAGSLLEGWDKNVERHVPCHENEDGEDLP